MLDSRLPALPLSYASFLMCIFDSSVPSGTNSTPVLPSLW